MAGRPRSGGLVGWASRPLAPDPFSEVRGAMPTRSAIRVGKIAIEAASGSSYTQAILPTLQHGRDSISWDRALAPGQRMQLGKEQLFPACGLDLDRADHVHELRILH